MPDAAPTMQLGPMGQRQPTPQELELQLEMARAQMEHQKALWENTRSVLATSLRSAANSYRFVTWMNVAMFAVGLVLFTASAIYGTFFAEDALPPLLFAGLGAGTFVGLFLTRAIEKTQDALSNLVQVEIAFLQWFEQMGIWTRSTGPGGVSPQAASDAMQRRSQETMALLQSFTESGQQADVEKPDAAPLPG